MWQFRTRAAGDALEPASFKTCPSFGQVLVHLRQSRSDDPSVGFEIIAPPDARPEQCNELRHQGCVVRTDASGEWPASRTSSRAEHLRDRIW